MRKLWVIDSIINIRTSIKYISGRDLSQSTKIKDVPLKTNVMYLSVFSFYNKKYDKYVFTLLIQFGSFLQIIICITWILISIYMRLENEFFDFFGNRKQRKCVHTTYVIVSYTIYGYINLFLNCLKVNINHNFERCKLYGTFIKSKCKGGNAYP